MKKMMLVTMITLVSTFAHANDIQSFIANVSGEYNLSAAVKGNCPDTAKVEKSPYFENALVVKAAGSQFDIRSINTPVENPALGGVSKTTESATLEGTTLTYVEKNCGLLGCSTALTATISGGGHVNYLTIANKTTKCEYSLDVQQ